MKEKSECEGSGGLEVLVASAAVTSGQIPKEIVPIMSYSTSSPSEAAGFPAQWMSERAMNGQPYSPSTLHPPPEKNSGPLE